ncbi:carbohydrate ABC transporter permease [Sporolactobacillus shoreicorticis]|uniref:Carbohydrate ABC transporter permease n=1 Tax=Sporolactobacillus shoreicorticis TaxID=1923877 RepID=A0ABW5RXJ2_9BACL|nr:carbohydrate ABC transporter permease [Sporolactobacillus shoreicorticis]MCO7124802.1 carbohydrate ABC transporter permease [Sporolactobacillus shoreicorticis]
MANRRLITKAVLYLILILLAFMMVLPLIWMFLSSFKTGSEIFAQPPVWIPETFQWKNYLNAFNLAPFGIYLANSLITATAITVIQIMLSSMIAYGLTQLEFKGKAFLFQSMLLTYMLPAAVTYVPSYVILAKLGLLDSLTGIVVSNISSVFSIFLLRQSFLKVPKEIVEAARSEGANDWQILWKVMCPMSLSTIFTLAMITFVEMYNNYLWPSLIVKSQSKYLITVGLNQFFTTQGTFQNQWAMIMAVNVISVAPLLLLFFIFQKWFIKGVGDSGLKG